MIKTNNFNPATDPKMLCTCRHPQCDKRSISQDTADRSQQVRDDIKRPMEVTSGGRCPNHPDELHRSEPADHQLCRGIDIRANGASERGQLIVAGLKAGFNAFGVGKTFIHLAHRPELIGKAPYFWEYS